MRIRGGPRGTCNSFALSLSPCVTSTTLLKLMCLMHLLFIVQLMYPICLELFSQCASCITHMMSVPYVSQRARMHANVNKFVLIEWNPRAPKTHIRSPSSATECTRCLTPLLRRWAGIKQELKEQSRAKQEPTENERLPDVSVVAGLRFARLLQQISSPGW